MSDPHSYPTPTPTPRGPVVPEGSLAALVHDMRGPLDAIRNAGHLLTLARDDFTTAKMLRLIDRQVAYLSSIADMLAELARASPIARAPIIASGVGVRCRRCRLIDWK